MLVGHDLDDLELSGPEVLEDGDEMVEVDEGNFDVFEM